MRYLFAFVLLLSATAKVIYPLAPSSLLFGKSHLLILLVQFEFLLAIWIVSGYFKEQMIGACIAFFGGASIITVYALAMGIETCGCFGGLHVLPSLILLIDLAGVLYFVSLASFESCSLLRVGKNAAIVCVGVLALLGAGILVHYLSSHALGTQKVVVERVELSLTKQGVWREVTSTVSNNSKRTIKITGIDKNCSCIASSELPISIAPDASQKVIVKIKDESSSKGTVRGAFRIYTDCPTNQTLLVVY